MVGETIDNTIKLILMAIVVIGGFILLYFTWQYFSPYFSVGEAGEYDTSGTDVTKIEIYNVKMSCERCEKKEYFFNQEIKVPGGVAGSEGIDWQGEGNYPLIQPITAEISQLPIEDGVVIVEVVDEKLGDYYRKCGRWYKLAYPTTQLRLLNLEFQNLNENKREIVEFIGKTEFESGASQEPEQDGSVIVYLSLGSPVFYKKFQNNWYSVKLPDDEITSENVDEFTPYNFAELINSLRLLAKLGNPISNEEEPTKQGTIIVEVLDESTRFYRRCGNNWLTLYNAEERIDSGTSNSYLENEVKQGRKILKKIESVNYIPACKISIGKLSQKSQSVYSTEVFGDGGCKEQKADFVLLKDGKSIEGKSADFKDEGNFVARVEFLITKEYIESLATYYTEEEINNILINEFGESNDIGHLREEDGKNYIYLRESGSASPQRTDWYLEGKEVKWDSWGKDEEIGKFLQGKDYNEIVIDNSWTQDYPKLNKIHRAILMNNFFYKE